MAKTRINVTGGGLDWQPPAPSTEGAIADSFYASWLRSMQAHVTAQLAAAPASRREPLFLVAPPRHGVELFGLYLHALPPHRRQFHNCHACRRFVNLYGRIVTINAGSGIAASLCWQPAEMQDPDIKVAIEALRRFVESAPVVSLFLDCERTWGTPESPKRGASEPWRHMALTPPAAYVTPSETNARVIGEHHKDVEGLATALKRYNTNLIQRAISITKRCTMHPLLGSQAPWFSIIAKTYRKQPDVNLARNILMAYAAVSPAGWCRLSSTTFGSLLEDLRAGLSDEAAYTKLQAKLDPHVYQRPQAAPAIGNVRAAERLIADAGLEPALHRRYASLVDLKPGIVWQRSWPRRRRVVLDSPTTGTGVFGDVRVKTRTLSTASGAPLHLPPIIGRFTWARFATDVLPEVRQLWLLVTSTRQDYGAFTTAVDPAAPPILRWDHETQRNPVSIYRYISGSHPLDWGLSPYTTPFARITGVVRTPMHWGGRPALSSAADQFPETVCLVLEHAEDRRTATAGLALFPEVLHGNLRGIRATIEAFSSQGRLELPPEGAAPACGLFVPIDAAPHTNITLIVEFQDRPGVHESYLIDRWR